MRILLAEDDRILSDGLSKLLARSGYVVDAVMAGDDADFALQTAPYDLVVLDLGLPKMDGLEVLQNVRRRNSRVPVLILTARDTLADRVRGLDLGADDYLTKPFDLPELEARIRALIRRQHFDAHNELVYGALRFDTVGRRLYAGTEPVELSAREVGLLEVLLKHVGQVVSKEQVMENLYGWEEEVGFNAIEVSIHRLRKKLSPYGFQLKTIRGLGYLLEEPTP